MDLVPLNEKNWCQGTLFFQGWKILVKGNLIWDLNIHLSKVWSSFANGEHENMRVQEMRSLWISHITAGLQWNTLVMSEIALQKSSVNCIYKKMLYGYVMWPCVGKTYSLCLTLFSEISYTSGESQPKNWTWHVMFACSHSFSFDFLYSLLVFLKRSRTGNKHNNLGDILTNSGQRLDPDRRSVLKAMLNAA